MKKSIFFNRIKCSKFISICTNNKVRSSGWWSTLSARW